MKANIKIFFIVIVILILGVILIAAYRSAGQEDTSGKYNTFAQCLKDKGAVFYGASWCPHCQAQKKLFGSSKQFLPYVECSTLTGGQTQFCKDKKIMGYPTWELTDGTRIPDK